LFDNSNLIKYNPYISHFLNWLEGVKRMKIKAGQPVPCPCPGGCNHQLQIKEDNLAVDKKEKITLECTSCKLEKKVTGRELIQIINSVRNVG
jgi:hypothetical protein